MKVIVQTVRSLEANVFEIEFSMDSQLCRGKLTREAAGSGFLWHADPNLSKAWQHRGMLSKHVLKIVGNFSRGKQVDFPVNLGDF